MGTTTRFLILIPPMLVLFLCLLPVLTLASIQSQLTNLVPSLYDTDSSQKLISDTKGRDYKSSETEIYTLSTNPLVIYITNFITPLEASELVALSNDNFRPSPLYSDDGTLIHDPNYRSSLTATLPSSEIVRRIISRAQAFPFYSFPDTEAEKKIKPLVVQKYGLGKQYKDHYDWFLPHPSLTGNIVSTFFVYISANCTGGGTNFPRLQLSSFNNASSGIMAGGEESQWCEYIDCDRPYIEGVTFKPITGNAIYWENVDSNGEGQPSTLHAGLPVTSGEKMGLNIWSWVDY